MTGQVLLGAVPADYAQAATAVVQATAQVSKPVTLSAKQDLDFGTILVPRAPGTYTVSVSMAGARTCPSPLTCTGTPRQAIFNTSGSNGRTVRIFAAPSDLINASDGSKIRFTPVAPASA